MSDCPIYLPGEVPPNLVVSPNNPFEPAFSTRDDKILKKDPTATYNKATIVDMTRRFNSILKSIDLSNYPFIQARMTRNFDTIIGYIGETNVASLTYVELVDFLNDYGYTISDFETALATYEPLNPINVDTPFQQFLKNFDGSLSKNRGCPIPGSIFGILDNLFSKVSSAIAALQNGFSLLQGLIRDFQQLTQGGIFDTINSLINSLLQQLFSKLNALLGGIFDFIDCLMNAYQSIVDNLINKTTQFMYEAKALSTGAMNFLSNEMAYLQQTFSNESMANLKADSEKRLNISMNQFEVLTEDVAAFVGARFTQYMEETKAHLDSRIARYQGVLNNSVNVYRQATEIGNRNAIDSAMYGARAYKEPEVAEMRDNLTMSGNNTGYEKYGYPSI